MLVYNVTCACIAAVLILDVGIPATGSMQMLLCLHAAVVRTGWADATTQ